MPHRRRFELNCSRGASAEVTERGGRSEAGWHFVDTAPSTVALEITATGPQDRSAVVKVSGEIDLRTADQFRDGLLAVTGAGHRLVIVDFSRVGFCDATGLGALVAAHNRIGDTGGRLTLAGVRPTQRRLLSITGLDKLFPVTDTVEEALPQEQRQN